MVTERVMQMPRAIFIATDKTVFLQVLKADNNGQCVIKRRQIPFIYHRQTKKPRVETKFQITHVSRAYLVAQFKQ